ncbi:unnamed protein product [Polarella glacialis]|nr:unnamed protein product [Polarella glacialis]CAE8716596.1 unnamed protein product [Polarella glacialis]
MTWFLNKFPNQVSAIGPSIVTGTIAIYNSISAEMLPTPSKSHYTFNLRDLSKVHQGICLCTRESLFSPDDIVKCWAHECQRVFQDRLINAEDHAWFDQTLKKTMEENFNKQWKLVVKKEPLIFGDFVEGKTPFYQEMQDHDKVKDVLQSYLMDYNQTAKRGMELVLFLSAVQHVCRIASH